eukprot:12309746-Ditylum_brightwellii.AAC.1
MEFVAVSWVVDTTSFAIDVDKVDGLSREEPLKIGKGKPTDKKFSFIAIMGHHARETQKESIQKFIEIDSRTK